MSAPAESSTAAAKVLAALPEGQCMTIPELVERTGLAYELVKSKLLVLTRHKFTMRRERGCYLITAAGLDARQSGGAPVRSGPKRAHTGLRRKPEGQTDRDKAWSALRRLRKASIPELIELIDPKNPAAAHSHLRRYLRALVQAGLLSELRARDPGADPVHSRGFKRFVLVEDTGAQAPVLSDRGGVRQVRDPNTGKVFPLDRSAAEGGAA